SALPVDRLTASTFPAADAAALVFGSRAGQVITALSILSLLGIINPILLVGTRIVFALARHRGGGMAAVSARGTPEGPLLVVTLAAMLLIVTGTFDQLFAITAFLVTGIYASSVLALIRLRGREPFASRPFRAWGYPWTARVVLCGSVAFLGGAIVSDSANSLAALAILSLAWPIAWFLRTRPMRQ